MVAAQSASGGEVLEKKPVKFSNLLLGAGLNMFEVTTLGQPLEVTKTTMAANRGDGFAAALGRIWSRGGVLGCKLSPHPYPTSVPNASAQSRSLALCVSLPCESPQDD